MTITLLLNFSSVLPKRLKLCEVVYLITVLREGAIFKIYENRVTMLLPKTASGESNSLKN